MSMRGRALTRVVREGMGSRLGRRGMVRRWTRVEARRSLEEEGEDEGVERRRAKEEVRRGRLGCFRSVGD